MLKEDRNEGTMFQAYQGISRWSDHVAGGKKVQSRMIHVLTGVGATRMQKVTQEFQELMMKPFIRDENEPEFKKWLEEKIKKVEESEQEVATSM
jgi:hypothetical protein